MNDLYKRVDEFINDERGDFGIKEIAMMVAAIVVIGFIVVFLTDNMGDWIEELWNNLLNWLP